MFRRSICPALNNLTIPTRLLDVMLRFGHVCLSLGFTIRSFEWSVWSETHQRMLVHPIQHIEANPIGRQRILRCVSAQRRHPSVEHLAIGPLEIDGDGAETREQPCRGWVVYPFEIRSAAAW